MYGTDINLPLLMKYQFLLTDIDVSVSVLCVNTSEASLTQCSSQLVTSVKRCIVKQMLAAVCGLATRWPRASSCAA